MPRSLIDEAEGEIWSTEKNHFFDCLDCERMTWVLYPACSMACAPKGILCKVFEFGSVQMFFDVLNNKFDIAVKFFLNRGYTHILTRQKKAVILRIYFEHGLFHRLSHSWQVIMCTNRIWPDLISPWRIDNGKLYRATLINTHVTNFYPLRWLLAVILLSCPCRCRCTMLPSHSNPRQSNTWERWQVFSRL